jgi:glycerol-3-phosphate dehydrogenase (NAD(P)+)
MNIGVIGGGSWGTTIAHLLSRRFAVTLWGRNPQTIDNINLEHTNPRFLGDAELSAKLKGTTNLQLATQSADLLVVAIPAQQFRAVLTDAEPFLQPGISIVSLSKGLEIETGSRMTEIIEQVCPRQTAALLTGPNLAQEIMAGYAAASVIATRSDRLQRELQDVFHSPLFRVYTNDDIIGCELGGVLKNIVAIAAGMSDGLGAGDNTRSAIITRGLAEMTRLGIAMGAKSETFAGLAGLGDLIATCTSEKSRNHTVGFKLGQGMTMSDILRDMYMVAEGVKSAPAVMRLAEQFKVEMPIASEVTQLVTGQRDIQQSFKALLRAGIGRENEPF